MRDDRKTQFYFSNYGISLSDEAMLSFINKLCYIVVINLLDNAMYVIEACKCKTIQEGHLNVINNLQKSPHFSIAGSKAQKGGNGAIVLPPEYFGVSTNNYFPMSDATQGTSLFAPDVTRAALLPHFPQMGGAKFGWLSDDHVKGFIKIYKKNRGKNFRVSSGALEIIKLSIELNIDTLLTAASKKRKNITPEFLKTFIDTTSKFLQFKTNSKTLNISESIVKSSSKN